MKYSDLANKSEKELHDMLEEKRAALAGLEFKLSDQQVKDVREVREIKKDIARILTAINSRRAAAEEAEEQKV